ncbi:sorting nexin-20-like isoform X2 [Tubulanus polymorphus]
MLQISTEEEKNSFGKGSCSSATRPSSLSIPAPITDINRETVHFEISSARIVKNGRRKHVLYTILIIRIGRLDEAQATIERRYSDFERLHETLKKKYEEIIEGISFPKKVISGNFKTETIAKRSRAFEQYLMHLYGIDIIQMSKEFATFFYYKDLRLAYEFICHGDYIEALPLLHNSVNIQDKLLGEMHKEVIATMCAIVAVNTALEEFQEAYEWAETALKCIGKRENIRYLIPLLQISIRLCWTLGKDKKDLEMRLEDLRKRQFPVDVAQTLLELAVQRFPD